MTSMTSFASVRVITDDVAALTAFYETVTGVTATWSTPDFAEIMTGAATLAIASEQTMALFGQDAAHAADNHTVILEFQVADVDAEHVRLSAAVDDPLGEPRTMPWGNRSLLLRDPDGNLVNLFTVVDASARKAFSDARGRPQG